MLFPEPAEVLKPGNFNHFCGVRRAAREAGSEAAKSSHPADAPASLKADIPCRAK